MWPIGIFSLFYFCTVSLYVAKGMYVLATNKRELLYKMIIWVDYETNFYIFFSLLMSNIWVGFLVATSIFGEGNILAQCTFHLNGRYIMMRQSLDEKVNTILKNEGSGHIVKNFERVLKETAKENLRLNKFAQEIQNEFTFRIFIIFAFSAMNLCALGFKVYTSPIHSLIFIFWAIAKTQEIIAFGEMGAIITHTTDQLSSMYYESKWENVVARSVNTQANIKLMKFIKLCMVANCKAFHLTGLNFFNISLASVVTVLRGAGSYFTFLISLR